MSFLPEDFIVPELKETDQFRLRSITIHDVVKDYDAVMSSRKHLWEMFGACWGWPAEDLSFEQDLIDLGWHQKEFQLRSSFNYAVMSLDEKRLLGCVYIDPSVKSGIDAEIYFWVRQDELENDLDNYLFGYVNTWIKQEWPFENVVYPGRSMSWEEYDKMN